MIKSFFNHILFDGIQDALKGLVSGAVKDKGIEVVKSLPLGVGLNDEEAYFAAEREARSLGVTSAEIAALDGYLKSLTAFQRNEVRLLISRRSQMIVGPDGRQTITNPDGAKIIKDLVSCATQEEFMALLARAGADENLVDSLKNVWEKALKSSTYAALKEGIGKTDSAIQAFITKQSRRGGRS